MTTQLSSLLSTNSDCRFRRGQLVEQGANLIEDIVRLGGLEREAKYSLRRELRPTFGVLRYQLHQAARINIGFAGEANMNLIAFAIHVRNSRALAEQAQAGSVEQMDDADRELSVAIFEFGADFAQAAVVLGSGDFFVNAQALILFLDVGLVDAQSDAKIELRVGPLRLLLTLELIDGVLEHAGVHLEADSFNVSALLAAEHVAGTA